MPKADHSCVKCKGETEAGFVLDMLNPTLQVTPSWIEGNPESRSFLSGHAGREMRMVNKVLRCRACGYLEYYATGELLHV